MEGFGVRLEQVQLNAGDTLVLYTDGVTEAMNAAGAQMGLDGLAEVIRPNSDLAPEQLIQKVVQALTSFTHGAPLADDVTLVAAKVA
jgi:sigma-B regulation protein RsbU (phosphoserine phosphatase)